MCEVFNFHDDLHKQAGILATDISQHEEQSEKANLVFSRPHPLPDLGRRSAGNSAEPTVNLALGSLLAIAYLSQKAAAEIRPRVA